MSFRYSIPRWRLATVVCLFVCFEGDQHLEHRCWDQKLVCRMPPTEAANDDDRIEIYLAHSAASVYTEPLPPTHPHTNLVSSRSLQQQQLVQVSTLHNTISFGGSCRNQPQSYQSNIRRTQHSLVLLYTPNETVSYGRCVLGVREDPPVPPIGGVCWR